MKITIIRTNTSDFGKIGSYNVQEIGLAKALIRNGHDVTVIYLYKKTKAIVQDSKYNYVYYVPSISFGLHGMFKTKILSEFQPKLVIHFSDNQLWAKNIIKWCKRHEVRVIQYMGSVLSDNPKWINQFYTKLILMRNRSAYQYSYNVAKTNKVLNEMRKYKINCSKTIRIGLDSELLNNNIESIENYRAQLGYNLNDKIILYVGRLVEYKKPLLAINILMKLRESDNNFKLIVIGTGPLESELKKFTIDNDLENYVNFVGRISYDKIYKYMVSSDCLINLSSIEIFGMAILEAMYYSVPVIAHEAPGPIDVITHKVNGFLVNSVDTSIWIENIHNAINSRETIGKAARNLIKEKYLWENIADSFIDLVEKDSI